MICEKNFPKNKYKKEMFQRIVMQVKYIGFCSKKVAIIPILKNSGLLRPYQI